MLSTRMAIVSFKWKLTKFTGTLKMKPLSVKGIPSFTAEIADAIGVPGSVYIYHSVLWMLRELSLWVVNVRLWSVVVTQVPWVPISFPLSSLVSSIRVKL